MTDREADSEQALIPSDVAIAVQRINDQFYQQRPHMYLRHRMDALAMVSGEPDIVSQTLAGGVDLAGLSISKTTGSSDPDEHDEYLALESQVLLFQTAEALLRLILAHATTDGTSPALNQAALKSHRHFYRQVNDYIYEASDDDLDELIIWTVQGTDSIAGVEFEPIPTSSAVGLPTQEGLETGRTNLRGLLRYLANHVLSDNTRDMYNSAKHGLAAQPGIVGFRIGGEDGQPVLTDQHGYALMCVSVGPRDDEGLRPVDQVFVWSNPAEALAITNWSIDVMDAVWQLGKLRHTGKQAEEGFIFRTFEHPSIDTIRKAAYDLGPSRGDGPAFATIPHFRLPTGIAI